MIVQPATVLLAPSRLTVHLDIQLPGPLAWWKPADRPIDREILDFIVRMSRENFLWARRGSMGNCLNWVRRVTGYGVTPHATAELSTLVKLAHFPAESGRWGRHSWFFWRGERAARSASFSRLPLDRVDCPVRHQGTEWPLFRAHRAIGNFATWVISFCQL